VPFLDDAFKNLRDLGLTYTQARVYLAVLSESPCTFYRISKISKVPRSEVYRETMYLEDAGLVEKSLSRPIIVKAVPVEIALKNLVEWKKKEHEEHVSKLEKALSEFVSCNKPVVNCTRALCSDNVEFVLISKKQAIIAKTKSMLEEAEAEVTLRYLPRKMCSFLGLCDGAFNDVLKREVRVRLMTRDEGFNDGFTRVIQSTIDVDNKALEVRCASCIPFGLTIVDKKQLLVETAVEDFFSETPMLWTNNQILLQVLYQDFHNAWLNCPKRIELLDSNRSNSAYRWSLTPKLARHRS
jgi:sugar-specific transcriptional regulator TrmB